ILTINDADKISNIDTDPIYKTLDPIIDRIGQAQVLINLSFKQ
ncbi:hypothetical protein GJ496_010314, partial [Pomphorhynchus laevis]